MQLKKNKPSRHIRVFTIVAVAWSFLNIFLYSWEINQEQIYLEHLLLSNIRTYVDNISAAVKWNTHRGGIYIADSNDVSSGPSRDSLVTKNTPSPSNHLVLLDPAKMTHQIAEFTTINNLVNYRLTSLKPINPENIALEWEAKALKTLKTEKDEYWEWTKNEDKTQQEFRYISPLVIQKPCLTCHAAQGDKLEEIHGGISISVPMNSIINKQEDQVDSDQIRYIFIWLMGMIGVVFAYKALRQGYQEKLTVIDELEKALAEVKTLSGFIPICASCKKVRNDDGFWD